MSGFEAPQKDDLERALRSLAEDKILKLRIARNQVTSHAASRGMFHSSGHAQQASLLIDERFREFLTAALGHAAQFVGRIGSAQEVGQLIKPIFERFAVDGLDQIPNVTGMRESLVPKYRVEFNARIASVLRDFEIGLIDGKPWELSPNSTKPLHLVNDTDYVDLKRLAELKAIQNSNFDLRRLIRICEELNSSWRLANYFAVPDLVRTIMDHIPPIFGGKNFTFVMSNHGDRTFKDHMNHLDDSLRHVADASLHRQIRKTETLPTASQVNFAAALDVLLGEVVVKLTHPRSP